MKSLFILIILFNTFLSFADAWDNLTYEEAEAVVAELQQNPYIFDYCDCCDHEGEYATEIYFLKVTSTEIITCDWDASFYSVRYEADIIAKVEYLAHGANISVLSKPKETTKSELLYMNYTWGLDKAEKVAVPFFNIIPYDTYGESSPCKKPFSYPTPQAIAKVQKVKGYKKWYKQVIK